MTTSNRRSQQGALGFLLFLLSTICALAEAPLERPSTSAPHVIASVNGVSITDVEVEFLLNRGLKAGLIKQITASTRQTLLEDLIFMRLVEQSIRKNGDLLNDRNLKQELSLTRLQTLLNVYLDRNASRTEPSPEEIERFISGNPQFFKNRRIYYLTQIEIDRKKQIDLAMVKTLAQTAKNDYMHAATAEDREKAFKKLVGYLQAVAGTFSYSKGWKTSEEIDPSVFGRVSQMNDGEVIVDDSAPQRISVLMLQSSQAVRIDDDQARQVAAQMIGYEQSRAVANRLLNELRSRADIRYGAAAERVAIRSPSVALEDKEVSATPKLVSRKIPLEHLSVAWIASLATLLPPAFLHFRRRTLVERGSAYFIDEDVLSSVTNRLKLFSLSPVFETFIAFFVLIITLSAYILIISALSLLSKPFTLVSLSLAGVVFGFAALKLCTSGVSRLPSAISRNRWGPIASLLSAQVFTVLLVLVNAPAQ